MKIAIYGAGILGLQVYYLLRDTLSSEYEVCGFIDDTKSAGDIIVDNIKNLGGAAWAASNLEKSIAIVNGIGPSNLVSRYQRYVELKSKGFKFPNLIHPRAFVDKTASLGEGNIVLAGAVIDHSVKLGNCCYIDINTSLSHNSNIGNNVFFTVGAVTAGFVTIEDHCFIGMNSSISDSVKIKSNCFVSAQSLVSSNMDENSRLVTAFQRKVFVANEV